jgi:transcriptional regulator GlxA family with amidase domain
MRAESGILNGWEATTASVFYDLFRDFYPEVKLSLDRDLCVSGPDGRLVTSGGNTSWQDMALYFITLCCGRNQASNVAKYFRIPPLTESQTVYPTMPLHFPDDDGLINECLAWIKDNYSITHPAKEMVQQSGISQATFTRRFNTTGY